MSNYIEEKLKEFRDEIYGENDALFDRKGNNVSQQVENFILQALQEQEERIKQEMKKKAEQVIKHYEELKEEIRSMRESNRNETRIIDSEQTEFAKALCGHYECLMCGNMVNGFNKYCPHCGRINKDY